MVALGSATYALTASGDTGGAVVVAAWVLAVGAGVAFVVVEQRTASPLVPLRLFRSRIFSAANGMTLLVYGALGGVSLFTVLQLQAVGWSALQAGLSGMPVTLALLLLSSRAASLSARIGPRIPMTVGPLVCAAGALLLLGVGEGATWWSVLPGMTVFALGLALLVSPLTASVLAAAPDRFAGVASGVNNAVARAGSLLAVAALPALVGLAGDDYLDLDGDDRRLPRGDAVVRRAAGRRRRGQLVRSGPISTSVTKSATVSCHSEASLSIVCVPPCDLHVAQVDPAVGVPAGEHVGAARVGDVVARPVHEQHRDPGSRLAHVALDPRGEGGDADDVRLGAEVQRDPATHRVPDDHHGHVRAARAGCGRGPSGRPAPGPDGCRSSRAPGSSAAARPGRRRTRRVIVEANGAIRSTARRHQATGIRLASAPPCRISTTPSGSCGTCPRSSAPAPPSGASSVDAGSAAPCARAGPMHAGRSPPGSPRWSRSSAVPSWVPLPVVRWSSSPRGSERARSRIATRWRRPGGCLTSGQTSARWKFWKLRLAVGPRWPW